MSSDTRLDQSTAPHGIARHALSSAESFLAAAARITPGLARQLAIGQTGPALIDLVQLLEGLGALARLAVDLERLSPAADEGARALDLQDFIALLRRVVDAEERQDWTALAALVERDVHARVLAWQESFAARRAALNA